MRDQVRITIDRPVEGVFAVLSDVEQTSQWYPNVIEEAWTSEGSVGVGSTRRAVSKSFGVRNENEAKVTVFEPNRMIRMTSTKSQIPFEISIGFEEVPGGTDVSWSVVMSPTDIYRPITRPSFPAFIRQLRAALENLKAMMESGAL